MAKSKLTVEHQRLKLLERSIGHHVEFEHLVERIPLPLRARNVSAKHNPRKVTLTNPTGGFRNSGRFEAIAEGQPKITQGNIVLEIGGLIQKPRG